MPQTVTLGNYWSHETHWIFRWTQGLLCIKLGGSVTADLSCCPDKNFLTSIKWWQASASEATISRPVSKTVCQISAHASSSPVSMQLLLRPPLKTIHKKEEKSGGGGGELWLRHDQEHKKLCIFFTHKGERRFHKANSIQSWRCLDTRSWSHRMMEKQNLAESSGAYQWEVQNKWKYWLTFTLESWTM